MKRRPRDIGTAAETAVERCLHRNGFPHAEKRRQRGTLDPGDITGIPGLVIEVKGGEAARSASDAQVAAWLEETERERVNVGADIGVLVLQRRGVGLANAERWWAVLRLGVIHGGAENAPVRMLLADMCWLLRVWGYGDPLESVA